MFIHCHNAVTLEVLVVADCRGHIQNLYWCATVYVYSQVFLLEAGD